MPSPFPGMNPYLEQPGVWNEFHGGFLYQLRDQLAAQVLPRYIVRVEEHVYLHELPEGQLRFLGRPALAVVPATSEPVGAAVAALAAPATIELGVQVDEVRSRYLEVHDRSDDRLVTVIELLSPSNKYAGPDRDQYLLKRTTLVRAGVNYVELDLLRGGPRTHPALPACDYYAMVYRTSDFPRAGVWSWRLADPMPPVPVPLRPGEAEPNLDLKTALDSQFDRAGYEHFVSRHPPEPALTAEQTAWAAGFVPATAVPG